MKKCSCCEIEKEYDEYYYNSTTDTLVAMCKPCYTRYSSLKRRANLKGAIFNVKIYKEKKLYASTKKPKEVFI